MKDNYFFDESSIGDLESDLRVRTVYSNLRKGNKKQNSGPKVPSLGSATVFQQSRPYFRSDSSDSLYKSSERHKKLLELDSDIRELDNLGLIDHDKKSARSKSSFRTAELSPIKKNLVKDKPNKNKYEADYQEIIHDNKRGEESVRKRKVIREKNEVFDTKVTNSNSKVEEIAKSINKKIKEISEKSKVLDEKINEKSADSKKNENRMMWAVLRIQSFFRVRRMRKWFAELKTGKLFGLMLKCEKVINSSRYLVSFTVKKNENSLCVLIEAQPLFSSSIPMPAKYTLFEISSMLNTWNTKDFESRKSELLIYTTIEKNQVVLRKRRESHLELLYQGPKMLNNMFTYQILIYNISDYSKEESLLIDGKPLKKSPPIIRVFIVSKKEISVILGIPCSKLQENLDKLLDLVIIEGDGELALSKRNLNDSSPIINICTTNSDEYNNQYQRYLQEEKKEVKEKSQENEMREVALNTHENKKYLTLKSTTEELGINTNDIAQAAIMVQSFFRGVKARKQFTVMQNEKIEQQKIEKAALLLQSHTRGWMIRKQFPGLFKGKQLSANERKFADAAIQIQARSKDSEIVMTSNQNRDSQVINEVIKIQRQVKDWLIRKKQANIFPSVILIQRSVRNWLIRRKQIQASIIPAVLVIQRSVRKCLIRRKEKQANIFHAVFVIQRYARKWLKRRKQKQNNIFHAVFVIQRSVRKWLKRRKQKQAKIFHAVFVIQRFVRKWLAKVRRNKDQAKIHSRNRVCKPLKNTKTFEEHKKPNSLSSLVIIQRAVKKWLFRRHQKATKIQTKIIKNAQSAKKRSKFAPAIDVPESESNSDFRNNQFITEDSEKSSNQAYSVHIRSSGTPVIKLSKKRRDFLDSFRKSSDFFKILLKTGKIVSGIYLIITMELRNNGIYIRGISESGLIDLELFIKMKKVINTNEKNLEELCAELLEQLIVVTNIDGKMRLSLFESNREEINDVIYRRGHYISNRYLVVTIFENYRGVYLIAEENSNSVFNMKLGKKRVGNTQKVQEELSDLVKRLKIQVVLGQEMLVIASA